MPCKDFHHPFEPYDIQQHFMESVYDCIQDADVGIFESPTGTGKSLSLICASLTWLREHKRRTFEDAVNAIEYDEDDPEWIVEHARKEKREELRRLRADLDARLEATRTREEEIRAHASSDERPFKKRKHASNLSPSESCNDEDYALSDYDGENEIESKTKTGDDYSSETTKLMEQLGMMGRPSAHQGNEESAEELKIFFCSRTHSQISQFIGELKRVRLPPGMPPQDEKADACEEVKHLALGSRKNLCINPKVASLGHQTAINERCIELQQTSTPADRKCPFLPNREKEDLVLDFRDHALAKIRDIEEQAAIGKRLSICPYYATRSAVAPAEIVTLPYPLLLQRSAREALGISLKGHIVIIDEAHNLISAIESTYSAQITSNHLATAKALLLTYLQRFRNRLKGSNRMYVTQVVRVIESLLGYTDRINVEAGTGGVADAGELLSGKAVDQVNLAKLIRYMNESKLARKVESYSSSVRNSSAYSSRRTPRDQASDTPTLTHVQNFLACLTNPSNEGRLFWARETDTVVLRYLLLDPSEHFRDVVESARAVILAGGTMSPMEDYRQQLFPYIPSITTSSCGHLVAPSSLLVRAIEHDDEGPLDFSFKARASPSTALRVRRMLLKIGKVVQGGLVVFFPSYQYLEQAQEVWQSSSTAEQLGRIIPIYSDSRTGSTEQVFASYSKAVRENGRALLFSVLGGKLSEGINFADDLGRCVVVVGLPFPNLTTPEWKAKLEYLERQAAESGLPKGRAGQEHAENVCMRSVNQAIGRVIRHKDDWASIVLMDSRYAQNRIRDKLPGWIKWNLAENKIRCPVIDDDVVREMEEFFVGKARAEGS